MSNVFKPVEVNSSLKKKLPKSNINYRKLIMLLELVLILQVNNILVGACRLELLKQALRLAEELFQSGKVNLIKGLE